MSTLYSAGPEETRNLGRHLAGLLGPGDLVVLSGGLGAGKTLFAGGVGQGLGLSGPITSPTFILVREYQGGRLPLYHMDTYRLDDGADLVDLGYEEYFYGRGVTLIEWGERAGPLLPAERLEISFSFVPGREEERLVEITAFGEHYRKIAGELLKVAGTGH
ncbi:MAG TPA: tRNA (adenosine(37)-N6)-threonylcarbamoyltransferase complex ATPase subunit type 1 TsaE [Spirochaetia bacterium]|nr:tRNA (adenosine(37)-N6)-threonylcarbamoyltransferase complex ATPase subunit type 1 TsaE [Spirochaetia bacterium]